MQNIDLDCVDSKTHRYDPILVYLLKLSKLNKVGEKLIMATYSTIVEEVIEFSKLYVKIYGK